MKSHSIYSRKGFTLIEVMVVIGILAIVAGMGMTFGFDAYRGYLFRAEHTGALHILSTARNRAVNNFDQKPHGIKFENDGYILFKGNTYNDADPANADYPKNQAFSVTGIDTVIFEQLSGNILLCTDTLGDPLDPCMVTFDGGGVRHANVTVHKSGGIIQN